MFCIDIQLPATILNCVTTYAYTIRTPRTLKRLIANSAGVSCTCYVERIDIKALSAFPDRDIQRHSGPIYGVRPLSIVMGCYKISIESGHKAEQSSQARTVIVLTTSLTKKIRGLGTVTYLSCHLPSMPQVAMTPSSNFKPLVSRICFE